MLATRDLVAVIILITSEVGLQNDLLNSWRRKLYQPQNLPFYCIILYRLLTDVLN